MNSEILCGILFLLGVLIGIIVSRVWFLSSSQGNLLIDQASDPNKDNYIFEITKPLDQIPKKRSITLRIKLLRKKNSRYNETIDSHVKGEL